MKQSRSTPPLLLNRMLGLPLADMLFFELVRLGYSPRYSLLTSTRDHVKKACDCGMILITHRLNEYFSTRAINVANQKTGAKLGVIALDESMPANKWVSEIDKVLRSRWDFRGIHIIM